MRGFVWQSLTECWFCVARVLKTDSSYIFLFTLALVIFVYGCCFYFRSKNTCVLSTFELSHLHCIPFPKLEYRENWKYSLHCRNVSNIFNIYIYWSFIIFRRFTPASISSKIDKWTNAKNKSIAFVLPFYSVIEQLCARKEEEIRRNRRTRSCSPLFALNFTSFKVIPIRLSALLFTWFLFIHWMFLSHSEK